MPWNVGVAPKGPVQRLVPNCLSAANPKLRPTMAIVPLPAIAISGSLLPSGRSRGVLVKLGLRAAAAAILAAVRGSADIVGCWVSSQAPTTSTAGTTSNTRFMRRLLLSGVCRPEDDGSSHGTV